jgi:hypothetical protein
MMPEKIEETGPTDLDNRVLTKQIHECFTYLSIAISALERYHDAIEALKRHQAEAPFAPWIVQDFIERRAS